jgi:hypothetical protein
LCFSRQHAEERERPKVVRPPPEERERPKVVRPLPEERERPLPEVVVERPLLEVVVAILTTIPMMRYLVWRIT